MAGKATDLREVRRLEGNDLSASRPDRIAVEEPLEIRIDGEPLAVLMRTPGDDEALAAGFMLTEGIAAKPADIERIEHTPGDGESRGDNTIAVTLAAGAAFDPQIARRNFYSSSACGICGKASIEAVTHSAAPVVGRWRVSPQLVLGLPEALRASQSIFDQTGSLHAAGVFDREGRLLYCAEDVGRHNAVDKVIGRAALEGRLPLGDFLLMVSSRIGFEIAQKALMAGLPLVAAVSGASSLAIDLAEDQGLTLIGFVRGDSMTVYHGAWRLTTDES